MRVLISDSIDQAGVDLLVKEAQVDYCPGLAGPELLERVRSSDALIVRSATQVTREVFEAGSRLKAVGRAGVGVDNIDLDEATARGIVVVNVPGGNTISACEHTLGLLFALARNIPQADASVKAGNWHRSAFMGVELNAKVLGVIGTGKVGVEVARRARALGMEVIAYDPYMSPEQCAKWDIKQVTLDELVSTSDFVTLHCPLTKDTRGMIGRRELGIMKPTCRLINCARGGIVDEGALWEFLKERRIAGAALDVFCSEPPGETPLLELPNVVVTPHLGASTVEAQEHNAVYVADQVLKALKGLPAESAVNQPRVSMEEWTSIRPLMPLAEVLGYFHSQAFPGPVDRVELSFAGIDCASLSLVTSYLLKGLLHNAVAFPLNHINAPQVAMDRGIRVFETRVPENGNRWLLSVLAGTKRQMRSVSATLSPAGETRIVEVGGYSLELAPTPHMLITYHFDRPGIIGRVGTLLGERKVNIATMQVGRKSLGGDAIMILQVDEAIPEDLFRSISEMEGIQEVRAIEMPFATLKEAGVNPLVS